MARGNLSQIVPSGNLISRTVHGYAAVLSVDVSARFGKLHKNVLREITDLMGSLPHYFTELNFEPSEYTDPTGRNHAPRHGLHRQGSPGVEAQVY